jgi:hypothetical protein
MRGNDFMRRFAVPRSSLLLLVLAALPVLAGCGKNPFNPPVDGGNGGLPPDTPLADSPQNAMTRFQRCYENQVVAEYEKMFAANFRFTFSSQSDPGLVSRYGNNWGKPDEVESARHLFDGFTNELGQYQQPATNIALQLTGIAFYDDPAKPDSASFYKWVVVPGLTATIKVGGPEDPEYNIQARHEFYLVRGDVAVLDTGQEARADRWYIYRWDDLSLPLAAPQLGTASAGSLAGGSTTATGTPVSLTWGSLKAAYAGTSYTATR